MYRSATFFKPTRLCITVICKHVDRLRGLHVRFRPATRLQLNFQLIAEHEQGNDDRGVLWKDGRLGVAHTHSPSRRRSRLRRSPLLRSKGTRKKLRREGRAPPLVRVLKGSVRYSSTFSDRTVVNRHCRLLVHMRVGDFLAEKAENMQRWVNSELGMDINMTITGTTATYLAGLISERKHVVYNKDFTSLIRFLNENGAETSMQAIVTEVKARPDMHDKFWRYMQLFVDVISESEGGDAVKKEE